MKILLLLVSVFAISIVFIIVFVTYNMIKNRTVPDNLYTPFDYVSPQVPSGFMKKKKSGKWKVVNRVMIKINDRSASEDTWIKI
ncbi:DUF3951 domain-containing protein [Metabacillus litoralis]|uniref:DUF3951 domain-containing protein n=1 Tax=Metabacillus litoralis TaxID=152268 RepID=A0A5C6V9Q6_9BACI|nr:DUF3951 domain-containing protein [Metabacillus litoralis]TXC81897.1 DUF3951 domain-containing protein [Metabacillus litoralis]